MKIEINDKEAQELCKILEKQIEKTDWVIENKSPVNQDFLQKRVDLMNDLIKQIKDNLGVESEDLIDDDKT